MNIESIVGTDSNLAEVQAKFEEWRRSRNGRERIPDSLWRAATNLYKTGNYSMHILCKAFRVNHTSLKNHIQRHENRVPETTEQITDPSPAFIEVDFAPSSECVIELEDTVGTKMRMCFRGKVDLELVASACSLWRMPQ